MIIPAIKFDLHRYVLPLKSEHILDITMKVAKYVTNMKSAKPSEI
jgi:hypothetical protein